MRKLLIYLSNRHEDIFRVIIVIISVFILVSLLPRHSRYKFEFDKNDHWQYDDLYAPFDFSVAKPTDLIEAEKKEILRNAPSYFIADTNIQTMLLTEFEKQLNNVIADFQSDSSKLNPTTINYLVSQGKKILIALCDKGVTEATDSDKVSKPFFIVNGKFLSKRNEGEIYTTQSASGFIDEKIGGSTNEENILKDVLKKLIEPNVFYDEKTTDCCSGHRSRGPNWLCASFSDRRWRHVWKRCSG